MPHSDGENSDPTGSTLLKDISDAMTTIYKDQFGRGPSRTRTEWAGPDTIVVSLEQTLTLADRNLVAMHQHERLRETRMFFQYATVKTFCDPIERLTGRMVKAFVSGIDTKIDGFSVELFTLHPRGSTAPSRSTL